METRVSQRRVGIGVQVEKGALPISHAEELKELAMVCQEERREAPQMLMGCLWWSFFLAMVCLRVECKR